jgi:hypothetical protein
MLTTENVLDTLDKQYMVSDRDLLAELGSIPQRTDKGLYDAIDSLIQASDPLSDTDNRTRPAPRLFRDSNVGYMGVYCRGQERMLKVKPLTREIDALVYVSAMPPEFVSIIHYGFRAGYQMNMLGADEEYYRQPEHVTRGWL